MEIFIYVILTLIVVINLAEFFAINATIVQLKNIHEIMNNRFITTKVEQPKKTIEYRK